jgi:hypothetical protein
MTCCKCCCGNVDCEEGQEGKCCCGGPGGTCCQEGEYCCDGECQEEPCGCSGACDADEDCDPSCVCVDGECVEEGECCFKDLGATYSFTFRTYSGTVTAGAWISSPASLLMECTPFFAVCGVSAGPGLFIRFFDGTDDWEGEEVGNPTTYPCASAASAAGTYTLKNCTTSATDTLTLT